MLPGLLSNAAVLVLSLFLVLKITITAEKLQVQINKGQKDKHNCTHEPETHHDQKCYCLVREREKNLPALLKKRSVIFSQYDWFHRNTSFQSKVMFAVKVCSWCEQAKFSYRSHHGGGILGSICVSSEHPCSWLVCAQSRPFSINLTLHCRAFFSRGWIRICLLPHAFCLEGKKIIKEGR